MKDLTPILEHLNKSRAGFMRTAEAIPEKRWRESPGAEGWSAAEVVAHVTMVEKAIIKGMRKTLQGAATPIPLFKRIHVPVALAAWRGVKRKTPIPLDQNLVAEKPAALEQLSATRKETLEFIESIRPRNLSAYRFPHPFFGSLNIYDWLRVVGYHEIRHAKQIREIVEIFQR